MCIALERRTLKGGIHDFIYNFFEQNSLCQVYVNNEWFLSYMNSLRDFRYAVIEKDKVKYQQMINGVKHFVDNYESWRSELCNLCVKEFFRLMEDNDLFPENISQEEKIPVAYSQLCYHMGMMAFDCQDFNS